MVIMAAIRNLHPSIQNDFAPSIIPISKQKINIIISFYFVLESFSLAEKQKKKKALAFQRLAIGADFHE